jgi:hypothetical protein
MALAPAGVSAAKPAPVNVRLTSITIDPEDAAGHTTNAPGAWLNGTVVSITLGEISIPLRAGMNTFQLYGTGVFATNLYYGAVLFFDGRQVGPQIAVYNVNGGSGHFMVQPYTPDDCNIMGGANGGWFFDHAPGTAIYIAPDGTRVEVVAFTIDALTGIADRVGHYQIGPDGTPDMAATLVLRVTLP